MDFGTKPLANVNPRLAIRIAKIRCNQAENCYILAKAFSAAAKRVPDPSVLKPQESFGLNTFAAACATHSDARPAITVLRNVHSQPIESKRRKL